VLDGLLRVRLARGRASGVGFVRCSFGLRRRKSDIGPAEGAICLAGAFGIVWSAAAYADSSAPASDEFVETPVGGAAAPQSSGGVLSPVPASSQEFLQNPAGAAAPATAPAPASGPLGFLSTAPRSSNLLGDMWGLRPLLSKYGMTLSIVENSELFGNVTGGTKQGFEYNGLTTATLQMDTQRAFGWNGGLFNVSAEQIHGGNLSATNLLTLQTASGIEADRATRLWSSGFSRSSGIISTSKSVSRASTRNSWSARTRVISSIRCSVGRCCPRRICLAEGRPTRFRRSDSWSRAHRRLDHDLGGRLQWESRLQDVGDPQQQNPSGVSFPTNGGVLAIAEIQFQYPGSGTLVKANEEDPLARTYKLGFWYDSESFADRATTTRDFRSPTRPAPAFPPLTAEITHFMRLRTR